MEELKPCPFCDTKDPATTESLKCGRPLNCRAEPGKEIVFKDGICPQCGGFTHGVNNGPMKCEDCGYEQPQTYLIEFTEDEITEFRHYLNAVKNRQSLDNDIRMSVFKLLHKFPSTLHTREKENGENP